MAYSAITKLYAKFVGLHKTRTIDSVPEEYREQVKACVAELYPPNAENTQTSSTEGVSTSKVPNSGSGGAYEGAEPSADSEGGEADA